MMKGTFFRYYAGTLLGPWRLAHNHVEGQWSTVQFSLGHISYAYFLDESAKNVKIPEPQRKRGGEKLLLPDLHPSPSPPSLLGLRQAAAVFTRHDGGGGVGIGSDGGGDRDKFGRKPQIKAALKKAAGFCRGSAKTLHEWNERASE